MNHPDRAKPDLSWLRDIYGHIRTEADELMAALEAPPDAMFHGQTRQEFIDNRRIGLDMMIDRLQSYIEDGGTAGGW